MSRNPGADILLPRLVEGRWKGRTNSPRQLPHAGFQEEILFKTTLADSIALTKDTVKLGSEGRDVGHETLIIRI